MYQKNEVLISMQEEKNKRQKYGPFLGRTRDREGGTMLIRQNPLTSFYMVSTNRKKITPGFILEQNTFDIFW